MAKKNSPMKNHGKGSVKEVKGQKLINKSPQDPAKPFDFGGIPERSLKKNLGC